ncbi:hypothetical protein [Xenorhabdus griffiniae]|uniref:Bacteriophage protein n=1 Tax=Xenorhabdus griffiniae TaxID=351672 RepID=A0ABY9XFK6_9GAMM|nr:hypothetical protein [Xenorhabdus griffiniae]MBD1229527.1 hypothetical protein [Xenorhabdus griffiniae]MBE8589351.1 hypothetical protein [Xenorhabdus griffiniae]WMV71669.1 hypothetical protein QL128_16235 [Xenorhabdus griffiniae]WNH01346.1 hypothetical protein QL112_016240 [Xenorhabdus griffiniae]
MKIRINEDGSITVRTNRCTASYGKNGKLKLARGCFKAISEIPETLVIHNAFEPKAEKEQATMACDSFKVFHAASGPYIKSATIDSAKINQARDEHLRQIVREEIRQFVTRESERGGLFSRW